MSLPSIPSSFGPSAWGGLDALSPRLPAAAAPVGAVHDGLFARLDDGGLLGISASTASPTCASPAEFRDRLIACLCEPD